MAKHDKEKDPSDGNDVIDDTAQDEVTCVFREHHDDYVSKLEEIGFVYHDDEPVDEEQEEAVAKPENSNQEYLVSFFEGEVALSEKAVELFLEERRRSGPNYPLFRKFFKQANKNLLSLILHGLHHYPVLDELLTDLAYFHEFQNILSTVIEHYTVACDEQGNLEVFSELAMDFYYATIADGYDALYALKKRYPAGNEKRAVIDFLNEIEDAGVDEEDDIEF